VFGGVTETERIRREYERRAREIPSDYYSLARPGVLFGYTQRVRQVVAVLARESLYPPAGLDICEVGCGTGQWLLDLVSWGADPARLAGIDLDGGRIETARGRLPAADLRVGDAADLPWPAGSFDLVLQSTVFTSILEAGMRRRVAAEMARVVRPGGRILWYDFFRNNPKNANVRGVGAEEIRRLFAGRRVELRRVTLAPPLARAAAPVSWTLALWLEKLPWLRTHYLGIIRAESGV
jgi:ubiquinone/menaquinone biosynthesis C-methylase UbiE